MILAAYKRIMLPGKIFPLLSKKKCITEYVFISLKHIIIISKNLWMVMYDQTDKSKVTHSHYAKFGFDLYMLYDFFYSLNTEMR